MNDNKADIFLWHAFKQGDRQAFDQLFRRYYPVLLQYGSKVCPELDKLEDCIQELFIEIWQSRASGQVQSVKAYLLKSLKYKLYRQTQSSRAMKTVNQLEDEMSFVLSYDHFLIEKEESQRSAQRIMDAVNKLPNRQKEIIYLKIYQGLSYDEISEVMNINYQVARNLFSQSLKSLKQILVN
ncbi:MAG TPA: sigma-70 family RNA polymerase sigma factor [Chitinophagaceae bacterium]|nr:sigma-70 family RNA polymerase sigma factor [Chitinophagaceae bacterium]